MTEIKLYHGTSFESFQDILRNGFDGYLNSNWTCSGNDVTYFYNPLQMLNKEYDTFEECQNLAIESAFANATIAAARQRSKSNKVIVIELLIDDSMIELDDSCPNMDYACYADNDTIRNYGKITAIFESEFLSSMSLIYLLRVYGNDYYDSSDLTHLEIRILESLRNNNLYLDELDNYEYDEVTNDYIVLETE